MKIQLRNRKNKSEFQKQLYEQSCTMHRYFLDWRYKLFAGYTFVIASLFYFIFTWLRKPENYSLELLFLVCSLGILISIIFIFLNNRITKLIWNCQNVAYLFELKNHFEDGLYFNLLDEEIRDNIYRYRSLDKLPKPGLKEFFNPKNHTGAINWFFVIAIVSFIIVAVASNKLGFNNSNNYKDREVKILNNFY